MKKYNEKPLQHGAKIDGDTSTLRMAPEEIEEDYLDAGDEEGAGEASFEMQRYAAKAAAKNKAIATKAKEKVAKATKTIDSHRTSPGARGRMKNASSQADARRCQKTGEKSNKRHKPSSPGPQGAGAAREEQPGAPRNSQGGPGAGKAKETQQPRWSRSSKACPGAAREAQEQPGRSRSMPRRPKSS